LMRRDERAARAERRQGQRTDDCRIEHAQTPPRSDFLAGFADTIPKLLRVLCAGMFVMRFIAPTAKGLFGGRGERTMNS
jgi:hypothetical protein